jgi:RNA polymerase sigma factor (sigma-70 family)
LSANDAHTLIEGLVATQGNQLKRFLHARVRNIADVADITQEIYLRMLRVPNFEAVPCPEAHLFTVAEDAVQEHVLKHAPRRSSITFVQVFREHAYSLHADPELELMATQCLDGLQEAFDKLSPKARAVYILSRRDGLSLDEIAVQLGVSVPMVKKYLNKALMRFRERLKQDAEPIVPTSIENVLRSWRIG